MPVLICIFHASSSPSPSYEVGLDLRSPDTVSPSPFTLALRDDTHYHHKGAPLLEINEAEVLSKHKPTPPSYYTADWEDEDRHSRHGGLMMVHGIFMGLAFFVSWPLGAFNIRPPFRLIS